MNPTREQIYKEIQKTLQEIVEIKTQIEETPGTMEQLRLLRRKKELQVRQLWNLDQFEALRDTEK